MALSFKPATKTQAKARVALAGPSGSGKTWTALRIAQALGSRIAVIDTERGSASKYAGENGMPHFDVLELESFHPNLYMEAIHTAEQAGYEVLIIDSLSHAWSGKEGVLEQVDIAKSRSKSGNTFTEGWRHASPLHNKMVDTMLQSKLDLIVTMRTKTEYVLEKNKEGRDVPRKVGTEPIQRAGMEYEFDIMGELDVDHTMIITKSRCRVLDGKVFSLPGAEVGELLRAWLTDGAPMPEPAQTPPKVRGQSKDTPERQLGHPSREQLSRLFALKREHSVSDESLKLKLLQYGIESTKDLRLEQYQAVCKWIEAPADVPDTPVPASDEQWDMLRERATAARLLPEGWARLREQGDYAAAVQHVAYMQEQLEQGQSHAALEK